MAVKGWRRSWEMRATMLLTTESGPSMGRSDCMLHNDSAGDDRHPHTVRSSIPRTPVRDGPKFRRGGPFSASASLSALLGVPVKGEISVSFAAHARMVPWLKISYIRQRDSAGETI